MKLDTKRGIEQNVFSTVVAFKEFGSQNLTPSQEEAMLADHPVILEYKKLDFKGKFKVVNGEVFEVVLATPSVGTTVIGDPTGTDCVEVAISLNNVEVKVDSALSVTYKVDVKTITPLEVGTVLTTKELVCQAKCVLFENRVKLEVVRLLAEARSKVNAFENEIEETL